MLNASLSCVWLTEEMGGPRGANATGGGGGGGDGSSDGVGDDGGQ